MSGSYHFWAIKYVGPRGKQALYPALFMNRAEANKARLKDYGLNDVVVEVWVREYGDES